MKTAIDHIDLSQFPESVSDLQDKYFDGQPLTEEERRALTNFNAFRIDYLRSAQSEEEFEDRYFELQLKANLSSYREFLDKK